MTVNGKQLVVSRERLVRGRVGLVLIAITAIEYCLFLLPWSLVLLLIPSVRVRRLYRRWTSTVQLLLLGFIGYVVEFVCKVRIVISGGDELLHVIPAKPLVMCNHRCELDWFFLVCLSLRLHRLSALKIATWEDVAQLPFVGWLVQIFLFPSLCGRDKVRDLATIRNTVEYLTGIQHPTGITMGVFPEGATVSDLNALEKSQRYSEFLGIHPPWKHVLVPRTPGIYETVRSLNRLNSLDSVIDVTMGYLDFSPCEVSSLVSFWNGTYPREVHMHLNFLRWAEIPTDFDTMKDWLIERFATKEKMLDRFYSPIELATSPSGGMRRAYSTASSGDSNCSSDDDGQRSENTDQFSTTSTRLSNLGVLVAFSEDGDSPDPAEETISKDMRFIQYISNSYVISAAVSVMVNCLVAFAVMSYPKELLTYVLGVCLLLSFTTRWLGGLSAVEMDILPVQIDLTYSNDFYNSGDHHGYANQGVLAMLKELFLPSRRNDAETKNHRDKENYIEALRKRKNARRL